MKQLRSKLASAPLMQPARGTTGRASRRAQSLGDMNVMVAEMIVQANRDTYGRALDELVHTDGFMDLYWAMRELGEQTRRLVARVLYQSYPDTQGVVPDPRGPLPFSERAVIATVCGEYGVEILPMSERERRIADDISAYQGRMLLAWLQFDGEHTRPTLLLDLDAVDGAPQALHDERWAWQAAQCLALYLLHHKMYRGGLPFPEEVWPPHPHEDKALTAFAHQFAKALLGRQGKCPERLQCYCNVIQHDAQVVPQKHAQATGELDRRALRNQWDREHGNALRGSHGNPRTTQRLGERPGQQPSRPSRPDLSRELGLEDGQPPDAPFITPLEWRQERDRTQRLRDATPPPANREDDDDDEPGAGGRK